MTLLSEISTPAAPTRLLGTITRSRDADNNARATVDIFCLNSAPICHMEVLQCSLSSEIQVMKSPWMPL